VHGFLVPTDFSRLLRHAVCQALDNVKTESPGMLLSRDEVARETFLKGGHLARALADIIWCVLSTVQHGVPYSLATSFKRMFCWRSGAPDPIIKTQARAAFGCDTADLCETLQSKMLAEVARREGTG
jgi:hypothetical protein